MKNSFLIKPNYIRIYGHRGARGDIVENSIEGFKYTFVLGIKAIEFDVVVTKDNIPVLFHDYRLNKDMVKDSSGNWLSDTGPKILELTYEELNNYSIESTNRIVHILKDLKTKIPQREPKSQNL